VNGLLHGFILNQEPRIASMTDLLVAFGVVLVAAGLATLSYFYLERPIRQVGHRIRFKHTSSSRRSLPGAAEWANVARPPEAIENLDPFHPGPERQPEAPAV
jgi:peptidoglycan/LPS O-acetylase OafA/YrhL